MAREARNHKPRPEVEVPTDPEVAEFRYEGAKCGVCGRYPEVLVGPFLRGMKIPEDPMVIFKSEIWNEGLQGRELWPFAQEPVAMALKKRRLAGLEITPAY